MKVLLCLALAILAGAVPARAQGPGVRAGISVDPDQFYFGGHFETDALVDRLHFRPNIEVGVGDDVVATTINMEFVYKFPTRSPWGLYAGAGPAVNFYSYGSGNEHHGNDTETDGGLNFLIGVENKSGLMFELKIGAIDSPTVKFGVGWTFH